MKQTQRICVGLRVFLFAFAAFLACAAPAKAGTPLNYDVTPGSDGKTDYESASVLFGSNNEGYYDTITFTNGTVVAGGSLTLAIENSYSTTLALKSIDVSAEFLDNSFSGLATTEFGIGNLVASTTWSISQDNNDWTGTFTVAAGDVLTFKESAFSKLRVASPFGDWDDSTKGNGGYATVNLREGATLSIPDSVNIGELTTERVIASSTEDSIVDVDSILDTLTVNNGIDNYDYLSTVGTANGLTKTGDGTLEAVVNTNNPSYRMGNFTLEGGSFVLRPSSGLLVDVSASNVTFNFNTLEADAGTTLDLRTTNTIEVENATDVSTAMLLDRTSVNVYYDSTLGTYTNFNVAGDVEIDPNLGTKEAPTTFTVISDDSSKGPDSMDVITTYDGGGIDYNLVAKTDNVPDITIVSNVLGKDYTPTVVYDDDNDGMKLVFTAKQKKIATNAKTANTRNAASYIDRAIANNQYGSMYNQLLQVQMNPTQLRQLTGEIYASTVASELTNTRLVMQNVNEQLRNIPLVTYTGQKGNTQGNTQDNAGAAGLPGVNTETGGWNTAPYGPGYAPAYDQQPGTEQPVGLYRRSVFDEEGNGIVRGQNCGDPGTLIYSAWLTGYGGTGEVSSHGEYYGYDTDRYGGILGLDLFGSTDCRFGAFYGYQTNKIKQTTDHYGNAKGTDHLLGLYHQWGDEFIYNIITVRGGYDRYKTDRTLDIGTVHDTFESKRHAYLGGAGYERGAHFQLGDAFLLSPFAGVDYEFLHMNDFTESSTSNSGFAISGRKHGYQSLYSTVGATLALRMYPGNQELALIAHGNWQHEFLDNYKGRQTFHYSGFNSAAGSFEVYGNTLGRDWALLGIGAEWIPIPELVLYLNWDYLKNKYISDHLWSVGARYRW